MRQLPGSTSPSRRWSLVLLLAALCAVLAVAPGMAQAPAAAAAQGAQVTAVTPAPVAATADFLASLSVAPTSGPSGVTPAPAFASGCTSSAQCPAGQICCLACGYAGCENRACFATKTCPHFP